MSGVPNWIAAAIFSPLFVGLAFFMLQGWIESISTRVTKEYLAYHSECWRHEKGETDE